MERRAGGADPLRLDPCVERDHARGLRDLLDPEAARGNLLRARAEGIDLDEDAHAALAELHDVLDELAEDVADHGHEARVSVDLADGRDRVLVADPLLREMAA